MVNSKHNRTDIYIALIINDQTFSVKDNPDLNKHYYYSKYLTEV